jgi:homoserine kinase
VVEVEFTNTGTVECVEIQGDGGKLPLQSERNCATHVASEVLKRFGSPEIGLRLKLTKGLPLGSGLGSSAASGVAAALATASLLAQKIDRLDLLDACREGERLATGSPHPDNVAPALLGGMVACLPRGGEAIEIVRLRVPDDLIFVCVKPDFAIATQMARSLVPASVPLADHVENAGNLAGLISGLASGDMGLVSRCLVDRLATPYRAPLIDGYEVVTQAALSAGALGAGISGSGPTLFALTQGDLQRAGTIRDAMVAAFESRGHGTLAFVSHLDPVGARLESL